MTQEEKDEGTTQEQSSTTNTTNTTVPSLDDEIGVEKDSGSENNDEAPISTTETNETDTPSTAVATETGTDTVEFRWEDETEDEKKLADLYPTTTAAERYRFLTRAKGSFRKASAALKAYVAWRSTTDSLSDSNDQINGPFRKEWAMVNICFSFFDNYGPFRDRDGKRVVYYFLTTVNPNVCTASVFYKVAGLLMDKEVDRNSLETITMVIDFRNWGGEARVALPEIMIYLKGLLTDGTAHSPGRQHRIIMFPWNRTMRMLWRPLKVLLSRELSSKIVILGGDPDDDKTIPDELYDYIDKENVDKAEAYRYDLFPKYFALMEQEAAES